MITIHLIGDSLVTAYGSDEENILGGWGDHLGCFFDEEKVIVRDYAQAGRSTRSFLNEGRFLDDERFGTTDFPYLGPVYPKIKPGDFVFIEFGHNDDDSREKVNLFDRMTPLGEPDENGIYPTFEPKEYMKVSNKVMPESYPKLMRESGISEDEIPALIAKGMELMPRYGSLHYSYDCGATYKGYLKFYVDAVRYKGAYPVLVTPTSRLKMVDGRIIPFAGHHGNRDAFGAFPRIRAVWQLAKELNVPVIDLFGYSRSVFEYLGYDKATYLQSITDEDGVLIGGVRMGKPGSWPVDYNERRESGKFGGFDDTHQNRFGSYLFARFIAKNTAGLEHFPKDALLDVPTKVTVCPDGLKNEREALFGLEDNYGSNEL